VSLKVLICDTDQRFVSRAERFLASHGHQVVTEQLPDTALELARSWKPDVLVLSSEAADQQADSFMHELRDLNPRPAILLTGQLDRFDAAWRAWRKGADELLLKPVLHAWEIHTAILAAIEAAPAKRSAPVLSPAVPA
jgi:two-component system, LytTR family, response regulator AlgR